MIQIERKRLEVLVRLAWADAMRGFEVRGLANAGDPLEAIAQSARAYVNHLDKGEGYAYSIALPMRTRLDAIAVAAGACLESK